METIEIPETDVAVPDYSLNDAEPGNDYNYSEDIRDQTDEVNGEYDDRISVESDLSDQQAIELPRDIPDGTPFYDLAGYIDSVVKAQSMQSDEQDTNLHPVNLSCSQSSSHRDNKKEIVADCSIESATSDRFDAFDKANVIGDMNNCTESPQLDIKFANFGNESPAETGSGPWTSNSTKIDIPVESAEDGNELDQLAPAALTTSGSRFDTADVNVVGDLDDCTKCPLPDFNFANFDNGSPSEDGTELWASNSARINASPILNQKSLGDSERTDDIVSDDDFGEFECSAQNIAQVPDLQAPDNHDFVRTKANRTILECLLSRLGASLDKAFEIPPDTIFDNLACQFSSANSKSSENNLQFSLENLTTPRSDTSNDQIWYKLCNPDRISELRQHWWKSSIYASFLHSININPGNAMPAFASQLRLLEPVRLDKPTACNTIPLDQLKDNINDIQTDHHLPDNTNISKPTGDTNGLDETVIPGTSDTSANTDRNGIVNLDLDFFENQLKSASNATSQPKNAISMLNDLEAELSCQISQPPPPTTISLLPSLNSTQHIKRSTLSETVLNTLSRLPKLGYMRSSRLMFPVQDQEQSTK